MMHFRRNNWTPLLFAGLLLPLPALAIDLSESVQMHGFASQAFISTSDNRFFGSSDDSNGSLDFRELGLNISWRPMSNLQLAAQGVSRKAGETDDGKLRLDYALLDYSFLSKPATQLGIRLGRHKNPIGFYNLTRDVPNTRPSILLPESIYQDSVRNMVLSLDGGQLYSVHRTSRGDLLVDLGAGTPILDFDQTFADTYKAKQSYVGRLLYEYDGGRLRLAVTGVDANVDSKLALAPSGKVNLKTFIYSAQYNTGIWSLTTEYQPSQDLTASGFPLPSQNSKVSAQSYYLQGSYRIADNWEVLLRYDVLYTDKSDKSGDKFATATGLPPYIRYAKDRTVGLSWDVSRGFMLRAEYHAISGTAWLSSSENPNPLLLVKDWGLFALQASYQF